MDHALAGLGKTTPPPSLILAMGVEGGGDEMRRARTHFWARGTALDLPPRGWGWGVKPKRHPSTNHPNQHAPPKA